MTAGDIRIRLWTKDYIMVLLTNLFLYLAYFFLLATMSNYVKDIGGSDFQISFIVSLLALASVIMRMISGELLDTVGRKKMIYIGSVGLFFCYVAFFFTNLNLTIFVRALNGAMWGITGTSMATICTDVIPKEKRGDGLGFFAVSSIFAMAFSPMLAIVINNLFNFMTVLSCSIVFQILALVSLFNIKIPALKNSEHESHKIHFDVTKMVEKKALFPSFLNMLISVSACGINSYLIMYGKSINLDSIWVYFIGHLTMVLVARTFSEQILRKFGIFFVIVPGCISMILGMLSLMFANGMFMVILASLFFGLGYGAVYPSMQAWTVDRSPENKRGTANGNYLAAIDVAYIFGSFLLTSVSTNISFSAIYGVCALFIVFVLIIVIFRKKDFDNEYTKSKFLRDLKLSKNLN